MYNIGGGWLTTLLILSTLINPITFWQGQQLVLTSKLVGGTVMSMIESIDFSLTIFPSTEIQRTVWKFRTQLVVNVGS